MSRALILDWKPAPVGRGIYMAHQEEWGTYIIQPCPSGHEGRKNLYFCPHSSTPPGETGGLARLGCELTLSHCKRLAQRHSWSRFILLLEDTLS